MNINMEREEFNKDMLKVLKGRGTDDFQYLLEREGFEIEENSDWSTQGYPMVKFGERTLVISKDFGNKTRLYGSHQPMVGFKELKLVDFYGFFTKVKYEQGEDKLLFKRFLLDKADNTKIVESLDRHIEELKKEIGYIEERQAYYKESRAEAIEEYKKR